MRRTAPPPTRTEVRAAFGVDVGDLRRHPVGFESECWTDGTWFVKVWRHGRVPTTLHVLETLDLPVPVPLRTGDGARHATTAGGVPYAVFPHLPGRGATDDDGRETARALRRLHDHPLVDLPPVVIEEPGIEQLRDRLDHPWIVDRRHEVEVHLDRLERVIAEATATDRPSVIVHNDFGGGNLLLDDDGSLVAILDWDWAGTGPREHDVWIACEHEDRRAFLDAYGPCELDPVHLEYALLRRAVGDLAARVVEEVDRPGVDTWGFARWRRLDADLALLHELTTT